MQKIEREVPRQLSSSPAMKPREPTSACWRLRSGHGIRANRTLIFDHLHSIGDVPVPKIDYHEGTASPIPSFDLRDDRPIAVSPIRRILGISMVPPACILLLSGTGDVPRFGWPSVPS